ncbi:hypothetical protein FRC06_008661 [Ceratobasidium sp. 370]|nr:hypothetical protein FRC06_008661 [Ceratobasidium sp. 370]
MTIHPPNTAKEVFREANNGRTRSDGIGTSAQQRPLHQEAYEAPRERRWSDTASPLMTYVKDTARRTLQKALDYCNNPGRSLVWTALSGPTVAWLAENVEPGQFCQLPIVSSQIPYCRPQEPFWPDFPKLVALQSQLQGVMEKSTDTLVVAIDIKHSGTAVRDLIPRVKHSLLISRDLLAKRLGELVEDARTTGRGLQKFGSRVERVVDQTISMNEYTIGLLESAAKRKQPSSFSKLLSPPVPPPQRKDIKAMWFKSIGSMKSEVVQLSLEAVANMQALDKLDNGLSVIHKMVVREDNKIKADKAEMIYNGNELVTDSFVAQLAQFDSHAQLLKSILTYREEAVKHVTAALFQLERLALDLNDLNEQVTTPLLEGGETKVPLDVRDYHVNSCLHR